MNGSWQDKYWVLRASIGDTTRALYDGLRVVGYIWEFPKIGDPDIVP